jgi:hypothetical protein
MPAVDACQPQIIKALENEGWYVNPKPYYVEKDDRRAFIDVVASKQSNGTHERIMLAEVKCFVDQNSSTTELYVALGQYLIYRSLLTETNQLIPLYLAISEQVYRAIFDSIVLRVVEEARIKLLIVDLGVERIVRWIE